MHDHDQREDGATFLGCETWGEYAELTDKPIRRCSECNRYHIRSKMNTGERSFCEKCRTPTIKSKHAMRDWRKRRA